MKDNFSTQSSQYALYRPFYPPELYHYLKSIIPHFERAWDCGTGNGQVAIALSSFFKTVYATDISSAQIQHASTAPNISYSVQPAEKTDFPDEFFDFIIIAQAIHWFEFEQFYAEVKRTSQRHAICCVIGYGRIEISPEIDRIIDHFYTVTIGKYWDPERKYIDENYQTIPFPFEEIIPPQFTNELSWTLEHLIGYLNTWSAVHHAIKKNGFNPVDHILSELKANWGDTESKQVRFPLLIRIGKIHKTK